MAAILRCSFRRGALHLSRSSPMMPHIFRYLSTQGKNPPNADPAAQNPPGADPTSSSLGADPTPSSPGADLTPDSPVADPTPSPPGDGEQTLSPHVDGEQTPSHWMKFRKNKTFLGVVHALRLEDLLNSKKARIISLERRMKVLEEKVEKLEDKVKRISEDQKRLETSTHLACEYATKVWTEVAKWCNIRRVPIDWENEKVFLKTQCRSKSAKQKLYRAILVY